jgi:uncharacterized membrane protein SpoIIM required for sporulation
MDFTELFENNNKHHGNYRESGYHDDDRYSHNSHHSYRGHNDHQQWLNIWEKIKNNKKLKLLIFLGVILVIAIIIGLIVILWPVLMKLFNYVTQNGLQGILDAIWKGAGK